MAERPHRRQTAPSLTLRDSTPCLTLPGAGRCECPHPGRPVADLVTVVAAIAQGLPHRAPIDSLPTVEPVTWPTVLHDRQDPATEPPVGAVSVGNGRCDRRVAAVVEVRSWVHDQEEADCPTPRTRQDPQRTPAMPGRSRPKAT